MCERSRDRLRLYLLYDDGPEPVLLTPAVSVRRREENGSPSRVHLIAAAATSIIICRSTTIRVGTCLCTPLEACAPSARLRILRRAPSPHPSLAGGHIWVYELLRRLVRCAMHYQPHIHACTHRYMSGAAAGSVTKGLTAPGLELEHYDVVVSKPKDIQVQPRVQAGGEARRPLDLVVRQAAGLGVHLGLQVDLGSRKGRAVAAAAARRTR